MRILNILQINSVNYGSTGNIMLAIAERIISHGHTSHVAYPDSLSNRKKSIDNSIIIGNRYERNIHEKLTNFTGYHGGFSKLGTNNFLKKIDILKPDIIHIHNLHNNYVNLKKLFDYIKKNNIKIVWTLHDCWAFTGHCPHYTAVGCYKWEIGCYDCPLFRQYPSSRVDRSKEMYNLKKDLFTGVNNLTIVTPSKWLKSQVEKSFLSDYPVKVINNGIDLTKFRPINSEFRKRHSLEKKKIILGVAHSWSDTKGLNIFIELAELFDENYKIILVGLTKQQIEKLPDKIMGIHRTREKSELAEIYSAADYFINPSREETMGLVTVESLACGTPVIVSNHTAVPEIVNEKCGVIVYENTAASYFNTIINLKKKFLPSDCINRAKSYDETIKCEEYMNLYNKIVNIDVQKEDDQNEQNRNFDFPLFK